VKNLYDAIFNDDRADSVAVVYETRRLTYRDLKNQTNQAACVLIELNIHAGERVAVLLDDSPEFIAFFIAVCSKGAIAVPINMGLRLEAQQEILADCGATLAIAEANLSDRLLTGELEKLHSLTDLVVVERTDSHNELTNRVPQERERPVRVHSFNELTRRVQDRMEPEIHLAKGDEPAFILYTSGSTGEPKGAVHSVAHIFYTNDTFCSQILKLRPGDRLFSSSRLPFAYGLGNSFTFPLLNGFTTILCREKPTPEVIAGLLRSARPTILFGVPVVYTLLLDYHKRVEALDCSSLRLCVSAGEALPARLGEDWEKVFGLPVLDGIGSTEMLHMWMSNQEGKVHYGSSGQLLTGYDARLLDAEGKETPAGQQGNLWVRGASAALGYWQRSEATARTFVDGWVRTGDLYRYDEDGYWYHLGRSDDCFKSSGQWVSPVEVEDVLMRNAGISRVAVVEDFDENGLPSACAFVVKQGLESEFATLETELRELCRQMLPRHKQPRRYVFVAELPYTATGKIQRFRLRQLLRQSQNSKVEQSF
jgi:benzoate-CoA ligase family protein